MALERKQQENDRNNLQLGGSHAVQGVCLTLIKEDQYLWFDVSNATLAVTNLGDLAPGDLVNIEPAMRLGDSIDGHLVSGHVDGLGTIRKIEPLGDNHLVQIGFGRELAPYIAPKGSVCVDGTSLTINKVDNHTLNINLIPYTWEQTCFHTAQVGARVNLEVDLLARYTVNALKQLPKP